MFANSNITRGLIKRLTFKSALGHIGSSLSKTELKFDLNKKEPNLSVPHRETVLLHTLRWAYPTQWRCIMLDWMAICKNPKYRCMTESLPLCNHTRQLIPYTHYLHLWARTVSLSVFISSHTEAGERQTVITAGKSDHIKGGLEAFSKMILTSQRRDAHEMTIYGLALLKLSM